MAEPKRVRDDVTGHEYSTYGVYEGLTVLDEPAVDAHGELLPPKYPDAETSATTKAATKPAKSTGREATTEEH